MIGRIQSITLLIAVVFCSLFLSGCGTLYRGGQSGLYRAVQWDVKMIKKGMEPIEVRNGDLISEEITKETLHAAYIGWGVIDLPFSAIFDTICLPYDAIVME